MPLGLLQEANHLLCQSPYFSLNMSGYSFCLLLLVLLSLLDLRALQSQ